MNAQYARAKGGTGESSPPSPSRIGEAASFQPCPRCRRHVLVARTGGILTRADPENITAASELAARIQNRLTFDIHVHGLPRRMYLEYRDVFRIRAPRRHPVVAQHSCGSDLVLRSAPVGVLQEIVISYRRELTDEPPF